MIHALKMMGDYQQERSEEILLSQVVENPNSNGKYNTVLIIVFREESKEVIFDEILVEEFTLEKLDKYAYKYGNPRGGDMTPTSKLTDLEKTFRRIQSPLKKTCHKLDEDDQNQELIMAIYDLFQEEEIAEEIYSQLSAVEYEDNAILTIAFRDGEQLKYVGDFAEFTDSLLGSYEKQFYYRSSYLKAEKESIGEDNICYICAQKAEKTYGYVGTFAFYTLDKLGFTTGGFDRGQAWKNYPVCPNCAKVLTLGRKYLEENLGARFCGLNYFIIPKSIFRSEEEARDELFEILEDLDKNRKLSLQEKGRKALTDAQDDLFFTMSEFDNYVNFNLMFYEEQNSAFRILLYVEDVLPSYLQKIFIVKDEVDGEELFQDLKGKDGELFDLKFKFNLISNFFYVNQSYKPDFTAEFLEITNSIFTEKQISYQLLISRFTKHLQEKFRNGESTWYDNLKALLILEFLQRLGLLKQKAKGDLNVMETTGEYQAQLEAFLEKHSDVLDSNAKRLAFLEGVLAQKLLNIQSRERDGATPFRARLNGLKINEKIIKRLYPEMINKLEEYDKNYYQQLEGLIADYILESDFDSISNNELSFYFVTGMNQASKFQFNNQEEGD